MRTPLRTRLRAAFALFLAAVAPGCGDDGTGSNPRVTLTPGQAAAYAIVDVSGLAPEYGADEPVEIRVGGVAAPLLYDSVAEVHRFLVPSVAPGRVEVVFPAAAGQRERRAEMEVLPTAFAGGSAAGAMEEMDEVVDSMQVAAELTLGFLEPGDSVLRPRLEGLVALGEVLQEARGDLSPADRQAFAALYSELAPLMNEVAGSLAASLAELRDPSAGMAPVGPQAATAPVSATRLVARCVDHVAALRTLDRMVEIASKIVTVARLATAVLAPAAYPVVTLLGAAVTFSFDIAVLVANLAPHLLDPDGLRLQVSPGSVREDGGTATVAVFVRRQAAAAVIGSGVGVTGILGDVRTAMQRLEAARSMLRLEAIIEVLAEERLDRIIGFLEEGLSGYLREASGYVYGEVQVTFDGVQLTGGASPRWRFTGAAGSAPRGLETVGRNTAAVEPVQLTAQMGSGNDCGARTAGSDPASGRNGFQITTRARVRLGSAAPVEMRAGGSGGVTVAVQNEGGDTTGALTYALRDASGPWSPPSWLSVSLASGPSRLLPARSGSVRATFTAGTDAPERAVTVPLSVLEDGRVAATTYVTVSVVPQLSDVTVNRETSTLRLWDYGTQDGDIVTVTLNGTPLVSGHSLTNAGDVVSVRYRRGRNVLVVRAHNEGSLSPNTAALSLADVVSGNGVQQWGLSTGGTAQLTITFEPAAPSRGPGGGAPPAPTYRPCVEDRGAPCGS